MITYQRFFGTAAASLCAASMLSACTPSYPEGKIAYDPYKQYPLGQANDCSDLGKFDERMTGSNSMTPGLGCSHQNNLTLMVANPADLHQPRTMTPPDAAARDRVLTAYREGSPTSVSADAEGAAALLEQ